MSDSEQAATAGHFKKRLDQEMVKRGLVRSRSQAESFIKLGKVLVNGEIIARPGYFVKDNETIVLDATEQYVSRAGMKLASVADTLGINFSDKIVLDVGSSTGGFTDYALKHGASKVFAVEVGTDQMHPSLRDDSRIHLYEKIDIRDFLLPTDTTVDIVVIDVSFISLREILPYIIKNLVTKNSQIVAMVKPQFEAGPGVTHKGVIKNEASRRKILRQFEDWAKKNFVIISKRDSDIKGEKGNSERFYLLKPINTRPAK